MKNKILPFVLLIFLSGIVTAQTLRPVQWASSVIAFSSEFNPTPGTFSAAKLLGAPEYYPQCGSNSNCWAPATQNGSREYFVVGFSTPQQVNNVRIYQSWGPGAVDTVYVRNASNGVWTEIYQTTVVTGAACPGTDQQLLEISFPLTAYNVDAIRVAIASQTHLQWNEFDAVSIANFDELTDNYNQYATSVIGFSSEFNPSPGSFSADKLKGVPDAGTVASSCGSFNNAWAPATANGQREYFMLGYSYPAKVNRVMIHQTLAPGGIDTVYLREYGTGTWNKVYETTAAAAPFCVPGKYIEINFTKTTYLVDAVRVAINSPLVTDYQEIDAVGLRCELPGNAKRSVQNGNWSNTATWEGGSLPTINDTVLIGPHIVALDANGNAASVVVSNAGTLNINSNSTLNIGPFGSGGGNKALDIQGVFTMNTGTVNIGGRLVTASRSSFTLSGGTIAVDGNTGTLATGTPDNQYLVDFPAGLTTFSFTGGTINIIDPPLGATGNTLRSNYNFSSGSTIKFGNGVSTTAGGNANGFNITSNAAPQIGHLLSDALTGTNRSVTIGRSTTINGNMTITSGSLQNNSSITVTGAITNNASYTIVATTRVNGSFTNNGTTNMTGGGLSIGDDFINNAGAVYTVTGVRYTSVNDDVVNDGAFTSNWLFFADDFSSPSVNAQTISGTGSFTIYGLEVRNSNAAGVTPQLSLTVQEIYFQQGKIFLGNNNLTFSSITAGFGSPGAGNYVVTDGTGHLRFTNLTTTEILFPIGTGTTYNPVRINNGSGHTFSCSVQTGLTNSIAGNTSVNREWDITDVTGGAVSATVTLQWNVADEQASFNRGLCALAHYAGSWSQVGSSGAASGTDPYTKTASNVTGFSPFTVTSNTGILPVTLIGFNAVKEGVKTKINWQTTDEINIAWYEVQKSADGLIYSTIATVNAANTSGTHSYTAYDPMPEKGINYFRLRIKDFDGRLNFSTVTKVDFRKNITIAISPNPASHEITIQADRKIIAVSLFDMSGKLIKQFIPAVSNRYDVSMLKKGTYIIQVSTVEKTENTKLLIQ